MAQSKAKASVKRLWQIVFDTEDDQEDVEVSPKSDTARALNAVKRSVLSNKALPAGAQHGVIYKGLLEEEDSDDEELFGDVSRTEIVRRGLAQGGGTTPLLMERESVFDSVPHGVSSAETTGERVANGDGPSPHQNKPFVAGNWVPVGDPSGSSIPSNGASSSRRPPTHGGAVKFLIRSESDLELAVAAPKASTLAKYWHRLRKSYVCLLVVGLVIVGVYVLIIMAIVYGLT